MTRADNRKKSNLISGSKVDLDGVGASFAFDERNVRFRGGVTFDRGPIAFYVVVECHYSRRQYFLTPSCTNGAIMSITRSKEGVLGPEQTTRTKRG